MAGPVVLLDFIFLAEIPFDTPWEARTPITAPGVFEENEFLEWRQPLIAHQTKAAVLDARFIP
jgi:hypothetical protein